MKAYFLISSFFESVRTFHFTFYNIYFVICYLRVTLYTTTMELCGKFILKFPSIKAIFTFDRLFPSVTLIVCLPKQIIFTCFLLFSSIICLLFAAWHSRWHWVLNFKLNDVYYIDLKLVLQACLIHNICTSYVYPLILF